MDLIFEVQRPSHFSALNSPDYKDELNVCTFMCVFSFLLETKDIAPVSLQIVNQNYGISEEGVLLFPGSFFISLISIWLVTY